MQDERINCTEDRGVSSDAERQCEHGNRGEARMFQKGASGEFLVPQQ
jgi:hypothetical protein